MVGFASIYSIMEMNKRIEESVLKVHAELSRIGCPAEQIRVVRQGTRLQVRYCGKQAIEVSPHVALSALRKVPRQAGADDVWRRLCACAPAAERIGPMTVGRRVCLVVGGLLVVIMILYTLF